MIPRQIQSELFLQLSESPIVTVLGPRQSGKTTLVRSALSEFDYVNLEDPETRDLALSDPKALLRRHPSPLILDEIQRVPQLLSYLQAIVDQTSEPGQYVLTGSHQLQLREAIVQSLAGRTGLLHLLPLSMAELQAHAGHALSDFESCAFRGFLPRVHAYRQRPHTAYANYYQTYVERDVRQLLQVKDAVLFEKFVRLLAGRVGQLINYQSLGADVGVDAKTVRHWLSVLEASYLVFRLPPYFHNFGKRLIKTPKIYFTDTGLLCYLLGIERAEQLARDPLIGQIFENLIVLEALKARFNQGLGPNLYFFRDSQGTEIDLLQPSGAGDLLGIEIKAASTWHASLKQALLSFSGKVSPLARKAVIYRGDRIEFSDGVLALPFTETASLFGSR